MDIDYEIEFLENKVEELNTKRIFSDAEGDWDYSDSITNQIANIESDLNVLYEKRSLLP